MKKLIFIAVFFLVALFTTSCSNSYNKEYCNEVRNELIQMIKPKINIDSICIAKVEKFDSLNKVYGDMNTSNVTEYSDVMLSIGYLKNKSTEFDYKEYERLKSELLKEHYNIDDDKELNDLINKFDNYTSKIKEITF